MEIMAEEEFSRFSLDFIIKTEEGIAVVNILHVRLKIAHCGSILKHSRKTKKNWRETALKFCKVSETKHKHYLKNVVKMTDYLSKCCPRGPLYYNKCPSK